MLGFYILCLGIFLTSLVYWPKAPVPFEIPKVIFFQWFVRILVLIFGASFLIKKRYWKVNPKLLAFILAFAVWATISSFLGRDIAKSFAGNYFRRDGLVTLYELVGFSLLVSFFWKEKFKKTLSLTIFASSSLLSLIALIQIVRHRFGMDSAATFGNPVFLAGYLVCSLPFFYYFLQNAKLSKFWRILIYLFPVVTIILTKVSGAIAIMIVYLAFEVARKINKKYRLLLLFFGFAVSLTIVGAWFKGLKREIYLNPQGRDRIYRKVFVGAMKRPIFGWGWANVDYAFDSNDWPLKIYNDVYIDKAHSQLLEILATTGIPGLLIYLSLIFLFVRQLHVKYRNSGDSLWHLTLLSGLFLYLFHSQTNVISISEEVFFWLILGLTL